MGSGLERASTLGPRYVCMDLGILLLRSVLSCLVVWHLQMAVPMIHTAAGSMPSSLFTLSACVFLHTGPILVHRQVPRSRTVGTSRLEHCPLQPGLRQFRDAGARAEALASSFLAPSDGGIEGRNCSESGGGPLRLLASTYTRFTQPTTVATWGFRACLVITQPCRAEHDLGNVALSALADASQFLDLNRGGWFVVCQGFGESLGLRGVSTTNRYSAGSIISLPASWQTRRPHLPPLPLRQCLLHNTASTVPTLSSSQPVFSLCCLKFQ